MTPTHPPHLVQCTRPGCGVYHLAGQHSAEACAEFQRFRTRCAEESRARTETAKAPPPGIYQRPPEHEAAIDLWNGIVGLIEAAHLPAREKGNVLEGLAAEVRSREDRKRKQVRATAQQEAAPVVVEPERPARPPSEYDQFRARLDGLIRMPAAERPRGEPERTQRQLAALESAMGIDPVTGEQDLAVRLRGGKAVSVPGAERETVADGQQQGGG